MTEPDKNFSAGRISELVLKIEKENAIFAKKSALDSLSLPSKILGREKQIEQTVRFLLGYRYGHVVPFISVYGRSGSGKTTIIQHVCNELPEIDYILVNFRRAHTVFESLNLILSELGLNRVKGSQGMSLAFDWMAEAIKSRLDTSSKKLFVMVLDEFDVIFADKRGRPSDFVYKLIELEQDLTREGVYICIIGISNNVLSEFDIDDRVKSRIGTSEIFFEPYFYGHVISILRERAKEAFATPVDDAVLQHCAKLASEEHGDARRAVDLLRVAAERASTEGKLALTLSNIDAASKELQKDRTDGIIDQSSYHFRRTLAAIARITFLSEEDWHYTSTIVQQYRRIWLDGANLLTYRRVSEIIREIENTGFLISQESSRGRRGYGKQYKLTVSPREIGPKMDYNWWRGEVKAKKMHATRVEFMRKGFATTEKKKDEVARMEAFERTAIVWRDFVWLDRSNIEEEAMKDESSG
ncbi:MAG: Cdc6/Cdc18 family protein [Nitrosotalea sp.]